MIFKKSFDTPNSIPANAIDNAVSQMQNGMLYRYGHIDGDSEVSKLEAAFGEYTGHKYVVAVNSCGSAMFIALKAMGIQPGKGVFTNAFTFTAVPSSIVHANAVPVYVECTEQYVIDLKDFEKQISKNPNVKYFILSHMRGHIAELDKIKSLCDKHEIRLIEDCAHGLGKRWDSEAGNNTHFVGHHCEIACYSTQSHKLLNSGEGGFIATNNDELAAYSILAAGSYEGLYKKHLARPMDDALRPQVDLIDERIASYKAKHLKMVDILSSITRIDVPNPVDSTENIGDSLQFNLTDFDESEISQFLEDTSKAGVIIQVFGRNNNARDFRNWEYSFKETPDCNKTADLISCACDLRLPMSFNLDDIETIGEIITHVMNNLNSLIAESSSDQPATATA